MEQQGIILKNIDLTGISELDQMDKIKEEEIEFIEAFLYYINRRTEENKKHVIEELFDEFQTKLGILSMYGISVEEVMKEYPKHLKKLEKRPRKKLCSKCIHYEGCTASLNLGTKIPCKCYEEREE